MMSDASYLRDLAHVMMCGITGARTRYGGKTAWAVWWAENWGRQEFDVVIFYNPKGDESPEKFADVTVRDSDQAAHAIGNGAEFVTISPGHSNWEGEHERLRELVQWLGDELDEDQRIAVVHDEAPEYDGDSLQGFVRVDGNGSRCKSIVLAQTPGDVSKGVRGQCILGWIGPITGEQSGIFQANQRANHYGWLRAQQPYEWTIITGPGSEDRDVYAPVPEVYAS